MPEHDKKLTAFSQASGDSRQTLLMQFTRGWLSRNRDYYDRLAKLDISRRNISADKWVEIVLNKGFDALPNNRQPLFDIPKNPLGHIILPSTVEKRTIKYIKLSRRNAIALRTAIYFDGADNNVFFSRIAFEHLERNWDNLYASQVEAEYSNEWLKNGNN